MITMRECWCLERDKGSLLPSLGPRAGNLKRCMCARRMQGGKHEPWRMSVSGGVERGKP